MQRHSSNCIERGDDSEKFDDDGRIKRTGTLMSASAHIITSVIGSGVLSLTWCFAQLGWIAGTLNLLLFAIITWFTCVLMTDCYRSPDPVTGTRNSNYMAAVKANLGGLKVKICGIAQCAILVGATIGYTITAAISMGAIKRSNCYHKHGHQAECHTSNNWTMVFVGIVEIVLSQVPNFHKLSLLSILAAAMSFTYSSIAIGLSIAKIAGGEHPKTGLTGIPVGEGMSGVEKMWNTFSALGDIAFAYSFAPILLEIQDTLKSSPPENQVMKKATTIGISASTIFYLLCALLGYAAFGNDAPGNILTGFGFYDPFWLVDFANACVIIHLLGAYQVLIQPVYAFVENWSQKRWPESRFITREYSIGPLDINFFRLIWRTAYVIFATTVALLLPFFNSFVGLIGASVFWPLTVYFPIEMYISQAKICRYSFTWTWMQILSLVCLIISLLGAAGSIRGLVQSVKSFKPFHFVE